jgi:hypothetical protein
MLQVPAVIKVSVPPLVIVQILVVRELNVGVSPEEAVAVNVGVVPKFCAPGLVKVIVWLAFGVTEFEALDGELVPALFVAVTVKVYAVPFVSPKTVSGEALPLPVIPPGSEVTI